MGSSPFGMERQRPSSSQRRQLSVQALSQQTPSAQAPDSHSRPSRQLAPRPRLVMQVPPSPVQLPPGQVGCWQQRPSTQLPLAH
jgi:hypothetical protein